MTPPSMFYSILDDCPPVDDQSAERGDERNEAAGQEPYLTLGCFERTPQAFAPSAVSPEIARTGARLCFMFRLGALCSVLIG